ncbi:MAG: dTDP-4-dehydrorhamnose reductase [Candidatus Omnitrophota bacterium]
MKALVTGGSGMLGRALVRRLAARHEVTATSKSGRENTLACDLRREAEVRRLFQERSFELVIHTAAYSDVDGCERDPGLAHESNSLATRHLAQACGEKKIPFVYVSTDYVFDGKKHSPYAENDPIGPVNIYGMTKLEGEYHAKRLAPFSAVVRTSWLFGPANPANFVNAVMERLKNEKVVRVLDDQEDSPTYVADLAGALEKIGERAVEKAGAGGAWHEIFQVCNAGSTTRYGMALKMKEFLGLKTDVQRIDGLEIKGRLAIRPRYAVMSTKRYEDAFGKMRRWEDALKEYLDGSARCAS